LPYDGYHIANCVTIGDWKAIYGAIEKLQQRGLELKVDSNFTEYLRFKIYVNKTKSWIGQHTMIKKVDQLLDIWYNK
jgi:hypothetical protein